MPFHREIFKPLLNNLISILTLSVSDLGSLQQIHNPLQNLPNKTFKWNKSDLKVFFWWVFACVGPQMRRPRVQCSAPGRMCWCSWLLCCAGTKLWSAHLSVWHWGNTGSAFQVTHTHTLTKVCYKGWRQANGKGRQKVTEGYKEKMVANMMKVQRGGGKRKSEEFRWKRMC